MDSFKNWKTQFSMIPFLLKNSDNPYIKNL